MSKPKPCPFCGSKLVNICYHPQGCHSVECLECKIRTGEYGGFQSVDVWNKRPDYDRMADEIAELRDKIAKKDEMVSDLTEALCASVDELAELRDFLDKVATCEIETFSFEVGDSGDTDCIEYVCTDIVEEANELLTKHK